MVANVKSIVNNINKDIKLKAYEKKYIYSFIPKNKTN